VKSKMIAAVLTASERKPFETVKASLPWRVTTSLKRGANEIGLFGSNFATQL
jgi:hypothetical protein